MPTQVFELHAGLHSHAIWQEAALMRRCSHPRVLPLLGIALKVRLAAVVGGPAAAGHCTQGGDGCSSGGAMRAGWPAALLQSAAAATSVGRKGECAQGCGWGRGVTSAVPQEYRSSTAIAAGRRRSQALAARQLRSALAECQHALCRPEVSRQPAAADALQRLHSPPPAVQGQMLLLVTQLMRGGSLRAALEDPERRPLLRWAAQ